MSEKHISETGQVLSEMWVCGLGLLLLLECSSRTSWARWFGGWHVFTSLVACFSFIPADLSLKPVQSSCMEDPLWSPSHLMCVSAHLSAGCLLYCTLPICHPAHLVGARCHPRRGFGWYWILHWETIQYHQADGGRGERQCQPQKCDTLPWLRGLASFLYHVLQVLSCILYQQLVV